MGRIQVRQLLKSGGIAKGNICDAVVGQSRESGNRGRLLSTTETGSGDKDTSKLAEKLALLPELAGSIPEGLREGNEF